MTHSIAPQAVSRFLASRTWTKSRTVRGRITNNHTQGYVVRSILGETVVEWREDSRSYGVGYFGQTHDLDTRLGLLTRTLTDRYTVVRRGDKLVVTKKEAPLKFSRSKDAFGETQYVAETETHRFYVRRSRERKGEWVMVVWTLKSVGITDPVMIADKEVFFLGNSLTKAEAVQDVQDYRDAKGI